MDYKTHPNFEMCIFQKLSISGLNLCDVAESLPSSNCFGVSHNRQKCVQSKVIAISQNRQKWYLLTFLGSYAPGYMVVPKSANFQYALIPITVPVKIHGRPCSSLKNHYLKNVLIPSYFRQNSMWI